MQKTKTKIITALLLSALTLALFPLMAFASTGNILINSATAPQPLPIAPVPAGGNISLNFNVVTFSGSQFYLLFSADGLSQVSAGDLRYTTIFNVAVVMDPLVTQMPADPSFPGQWTVGQGWVNGTIPLNIPGGTFYIKAFDGATTALAVTQGIPVIASFTIVPTSGAAGTPMLLNGNAFPLGSLVNVTYINAYTIPASLVTVSNLTATGIYGNFSIPIPAPDLKQAAALGDNAPATNTVTFTAQDNKTGAIYTATYTESQRGLLQIGRPRVGSVTGNLQNATGIYGNMTVFTLAGGVGVGDSLRIAGNWFYPGAMSLKWDNSVDITPAGLTANNTGYFNTTTTVPVTSLGQHNITIVDNDLVVFVVFVNVVQSITISPTSGPIGTTITVNGYGFPAAGVPAGNAYNVTITFGVSATVRASAITDATGFFTTSFNVPANSAGGANTVTATANDTLLTSASKTFTVQANFVVSPTSFYANSTSAVTATGTGFPASTAYFVAIDNVFSPFTNTTGGVLSNTNGVLGFSFIQAGFQPGLHVVALYASGTGSGSNAPAFFANFTVLADPLTSTSGLLSAINATVTQTNSTANANNVLLMAINGTVVANSAMLSSINASVASIQGTVVTLNTNIGTLTTTLNAIGANVTSIKGSEATIQTTLGTITTSLSSIGAQVTTIQGNTATLSTSLGTITTSISGMQSSVNTMSGQVSGLSASISSISSSVAQVNTAVGALSVPLANLDAKLVALNGTVATISTTLGDVTTSLASIGTTVTSNGAGIATVQTTLGTIQGTMATKDGVTSVQTALGTVQTDLTAVKTDVSSNKTTTESLSPLIIVAIVLALIAAIAAIASIVLMRRKIAG